MATGQRSRSVIHVRWIGPDADLDASFNVLQTTAPVHQRRARLPLHVLLQRCAATVLVITGVSVTLAAGVLMVAMTSGGPL
ncbi:hypothetical protein [Citricoccus muralis]|uniref:Uncharacterized protein n=1 Tax=Citricoccus muralis TaxID=169134 RepID=A0ABY8H8S5_9MICC|nr:hypothetical protein [Citricoccus muralis]WFP17043.1 hypothetical protein P8192_02650 [Citricoccus muralis]